MPLRTKIEWADFSSNPIKFRTADGKSVWACAKVSAGCQHCYAEALAKRYGRGGPFNEAETAKLTVYLDEKELRALLTSKAISGKRVFIGDMTDIFGEWVSDDLLNRLFSHVLEVRRDVTFQLLTKRADRLHRYLSWRWGEGRIPSRHIHIGVSVENQQAADERIPLLLKTPAAVRFVSAEPLIGPLDLSSYLPVETIGGVEMETWLAWLIVGGESGPSARPCDADWIRDIVQQCASANVACFVKQLGGDPFDSDRTASGRSELLRLRDRKGGDPSEWPSDLRVRQFPGEASR